MCVCAAYTFGVRKSPFLRTCSTFGTTWCPCARHQKTTQKNTNKNSPPPLPPFPLPLPDKTSPRYYINHPLINSKPLLNFALTSRRDNDVQQQDKTLVDKPWPLQLRGGGEVGWVGSEWIGLILVCSGGCVLSPHSFVSN